MTLVVEENYVAGVPQTIVAGWGPKGVAWHWDANSLGGRAGWESTIRHLVNTRYTVNASYHAGFWCEHDAGHVACRTVLQWIVRSTVAAHSLNPAHCFVPKTGDGREQARFAEVHRILERDSDPNADCLALAYSGMPAGLARDLACAVFRADLRELARQLIDHPTIVDRPHFGHGWIQPTTRYEADATSGGADLLINPVLYAAAAAQEADMPTPPLNYVPQLWRANDGGADLREQASLAAPVVATVPAGGVIYTLAEDPGAGERWRLAVAGDPERLYFVRRSQITPLPPTPRDQQLYDGIAAVVNARAMGQPAPIGGITEAEAAKRELAARNAGFFVGRDAAVDAGAKVQP